MKNCTIHNTNPGNPNLLVLYECENCLLSHNTLADQNSSGLMIYNSIVTADNFDKYALLFS